MDGQSNNTAVHTLINIFDAEGGNVIGNYGKGFCHVILAGMSSNNINYIGNEGHYCSNHVIYISSGNFNLIEGNRAYGPHTDIKSRGVGNKMRDNSAYGGQIGQTNQVVDSLNGYGIYDVVFEGNYAECDRANAIPLSVSFRTSFDCKARDIKFNNNTAISNATVSDLMTIIFDEMDSVTAFGNTGRGNGFAGDGLKIQPTDGVSPSKARKIRLGGNDINGVTGQAFQLCGTDVTMHGDIGTAAGGSGTNSGCILAYTENFVGNGLVLETTNSAVSVINFRAGGNHSVVGCILKSNGGTHIVDATGVNKIDEANIKI